MGFFVWSGLERPLLYLVASLTTNIETEDIMTEITKTTQTPNTPATTQEWDPWSMMRNFFQLDPFRNFPSVPSLFAERNNFMPAFEVKESKDGYTFKADLPGIKEQDLELSLSGNVLTIKGKRESEKKEQHDTFHTYERSYGSFARSFTLPPSADTDKTKAELKDGVLSLFIAKRPEVQPKKIELK
jgi:HSP20 family protein